MNSTTSTFLHTPVFLKESIDNLGIKEDGVWAKYWYENVHNSQGFHQKKKINHSKIMENDTIFISTEFYFKLLALKK